MSSTTKPYEEKMSASVNHLVHELAAIRAGRANPAILDKVAVDYYGSPTPINQIAAVAVAEARILTITHTTDAPLEPGTAVTGRIDWPRRLDAMQQHTGEHILSGTLHRLFGAENVGFHIGTPYVRMDTSIPLSAAQLARAEAEANAAVRADTPVHCYIPDAATLAATEYRSKKELDGPVRLVEAGGDCCACCGTHLARTGEVGLIKIISAQHYKTGMRLAVACGRRAYDAVAAICADAEAAGRVLSAPAGSLTPAVENRQNGEAVLKQRIAALQNALADAYVQAAAPDQPAVLWAEGADGDGLRRIAMAVCAGTNQVACALAPGGQGLSYALAAPDGTDARALGRALNEAFAGRGGGKPAFCQGSLAQPGLTPDVVREKLSTLL